MVQCHVHNKHVINAVSCYVKNVIGGSLGGMSCVLLHSILLPTLRGDIKYISQIRKLRPHRGQQLLINGRQVYPSRTRSRFPTENITPGVGWIRSCLKRAESVPITSLSSSLSADSKFPRAWPKKNQSGEQLHSCPLPPSPAASFS